ncbi:MAG: porin family protein [Bacteroidia bacterium]
MIYKGILLLAMALFIINTSVKSQSCLENLYSANKLLDVGNTDGCLSLVIPCSGKNNDESVRWQAYRLMSIAYLLKGNADSSKIAAENMLDINPTYKPNLLKDPKDFINQLDKIVVIPKFTLGLAVSTGLNTTFATVSKGYVVSDYTKTYTTKNSFQFGTNIGFYLTPTLLADVGFLATGKKYDIDYSFNNWMVNVKERLTYLDVPVTVKYLIMPQKPLRVFVQGGIFAGYLLYTSNDFESIYTPQEQDYKLTKLNAIDRRNRFNFGVTGGLGLYYKTAIGDISLQGNYYRSFSNITNSEKRYEYIDQIYTYYYVDDDITLHNMAISMGYTRNLNYKVYRTKK